MAGTGLDDTIQTNAEGPQSARVDGVEMKQHSLREQIAADKYLAAKRAAAITGAGFRFLKLVPPGSV